MDGDLCRCQNHEENCEFAGDALTGRVLKVSGGFAIVQPGSQLSINAVEGFPLEEFSSEVCVLW